MLNVSAPFHALLRGVNRLRVWRAMRVRTWGFQLRAPTFDRWLALRLHAGRRMGVADRAFLEAHVQPGTTVVDIGANQGLYTLLFAQLTGPGGGVEAFEPDAMLHAALVENLAANSQGGGNVRTHPVAIGAQAGTMALHRSLLNAGDNRLTSAARPSGPRETIEVRVERLDHVLAGRRVDFIKMDVQGWEMEALRGMRGLFDDAHNWPLAIYFEFWPRGLRDAGSDPLALLTYLAGHGFSLYRPRGIEPGEPIADLPAFAAAIEPNSYLNLYALRSAPEA